MKLNKLQYLVAGLMLVSALSVQAAVTVKTYVLNQPSASSSAQVLNGLSAEAVFTWDDANPSQLLIDLTNTSTGVPAGFSNSDQILTGLSWDFGAVGYSTSSDAKITGGTVTLGAGGTSFNMDTAVTAGDDVSGEWAFGNTDGTGLLANLVSATGGQLTPFGGANLDGPSNIDGPQAGIVTNPPLVAMGGLGAVADNVHVVLQLDMALSDLDFLDTNSVLGEFGSDAAHVMAPEPGTLALIAVGFFPCLRRRGHTSSI